MVIIDLFLLKVLHWNTSVPHTKERRHHLLTVSNTMLCFTLFLMITAKKATTAAHRKRIIELFKHRQIIFYISTIWENTDGCTEHYICAKASYLFPYGCRPLI